MQCSLRQMKIKNLKLYWTTDPGTFDLSSDLINYPDAPSPDLKAPWTITLVATAALINKQILLPTGSLIELVRFLREDWKLKIWGIKYIVKYQQISMMDDRWRITYMYGF